MPSCQVTLSASTVASVQLLNPTGRIMATMISSPSETQITADGTTPTAPSNGVINSGTQTTISGVTGTQVTFKPIMPGSSGYLTHGSSPAGSVAPLVQLLSSGTPVIQLEW